MNSEISILMSVYSGDSPEALRVAGESVVQQTQLPDEIVIVVDGPVCAEIKDTLQHLESLAKQNQIDWKLQYLPNNLGLAAALNHGLECTTGSYIARMDADDYSEPTRLEKQYKMIKENHQLDAIVTWISEFYDDPLQPHQIKKTPLTHEKIASALQWRNIISHPTLFIKREVLLRSDGYRSIRFLEDYDLYLRLIKNGGVFGCIPETLTHMRVGPGQYYRRGGLKYVWHETLWRYQAYRENLFTTQSWILTTFLYVFFRITPVRLKGLLYKLVRQSSTP